MVTRKLEKADWEGYFDQVSKTLTVRTVEIEVGSLAIGDQIAASWAPLRGLTYDPKGDLLEVQMPEHDHLIHRPQEIHVVEQGDGLAMIETVDGDGVKQIIRLNAPLQLTAG